jgi:hypothetical protein
MRTKLWVLPCAVLAVPSIIALACSGSSTPPDESSPEGDTGGTSAGAGGGTAGNGGKGGTAGKDGGTAGGGQGGATAGSTGTGGVVAAGGALNTDAGPTLPTSDAGVTAGPVTFASAITVAGATLNTNGCDNITWTDGTSKPRNMCVVTATGNASFGGGYVTQLVYNDGAGAVTCNESGSGSDLSGFGHMANHGGGAPGWVTSKADGVKAGSTTTFLFKGKNHVIYRTDMDMYGDHLWNSTGKKGTWHVRWDYMVRTGTTYIVDSISYDFSSQAKGYWGNDTRSPYSEFNWSGTGAGNTLSEPIDGIEYAIRDNAANTYIFKTKGSSPFSGGYTFNTKGNGIPYAIEWKNTPDREMAYVSTLDVMQAAAGGGYMGNGLTIGGTGTSMPQNWTINYQLNGYQGYSGNKFTWQLPYNAMGGSTADATKNIAATDQFDDWTYARKWTGYPTVGFTLLVLLDKYSTDGARKLVAEVATIHGLPSGALSAATGTVVTAGVMDLQSKAAFALKPSGYNHLYHLWEVETAGNQADVTLALGSAVLPVQTFAFRKFTGTSATVTLNGTALVEDTDMFTSIDSAGQTLYVTFNKIFNGSVQIKVQGS